MARIKKEHERDMLDVHRRQTEDGRKIRDQMVRERLKMFHSNPLLDFPTDKIPPDKEYCMARLKVRDHEDQDRINFLYRNGWDPVPRSRHPEYSPPSIWGKNSMLDDYIVIDGCHLLMERPKEIGLKFKQHMRKDYEESIKRDPALEQARKDMVKDTSGDWQPYSRDEFKYYRENDTRGVDAFKSFKPD